MQPQRILPSPPRCGLSAQRHSESAAVLGASCSGPGLLGSHRPVPGSPAATPIWPDHSFYTLCLSGAPRARGLVWSRCCSELVSTDCHHAIKVWFDLAQLTSSDSPCWALQAGPRPHAPGSSHWFALPPTLFLVLASSTVGDWRRKRRSYSLQWVLWPLFPLPFLFSCLVLQPLSECSEVWFPPLSGFTSLQLTTM